MTTDFLVTKIEDGVESFIAYCVKVENDKRVKVLDIKGFP